MYRINNNQDVEKIYEMNKNVQMTVAFVTLNLSSYEAAAWKQQHVHKERKWKSG